MASEHSQLPGYSTTPEPSLVFAEGQLEKHPLRGILRFGPYSHSLGVPARVRVALLCPEGQSAKLEGVCRELTQAATQRITTLAILASNRPFAFRLKAEEQISLSHCQAT